MSVENPISPQPISGGAPSRVVMLAPGQQLNGYLVHAQISQAPHAFTYAGVDRRDGGDVVIRLAKPDPDSQEAVRREVQTLTRIRHPGLVRMLESSSVAGLPYLVLVREQGVTLDRVVSLLGGQISQRAIQELALRILDALEVVHDAGLVHCDLSPTNILVRPDGTPVLLDFEAAQVPAELDVVRTIVDATPGYTAPELYSLDEQIGPWTDLYSLAAVIYSLFSGLPAPDARQRPNDRLLEEFADLRCTRSFAAAIDHALALSPDARPMAVKPWRDEIAATEPMAMDVNEDLSQAEVVARVLYESISLPPTDDFPTTERIAIEGDAQPEDPHVPVLAADASDRAMQATPLEHTERRRKGGVGRAILALILVAILCGVGWMGWEYYRWWSKTEWIVDASGEADEATIGAALADAHPGSVVRVRSGVYRESLVIDRPVSLVADPIDGQPVLIIPPTGSCLISTATTGSVIGITFEGGDGTSPCIDLATGEVEIADNTITGWQGTGIRVRDGSAATIRLNQLRDIDGVGILIETGSSGVIEDNRIERSAKTGISVRGGSSPTVAGNHIEGSRQGGLVIDGGSSGGYADNVIIGGKASGIEVRGGADPIVVENRIGTPGEAGIYIYEGAHGRFAGNRVVGSRLSGVVIATGAAPVFEGNEVRENGEHGVLVVDGAGGELTQNVIKENRGHGIAMGAASTARLDENIVEENLEPQIQQGQIQSGR